MKYLEDLKFTVLVCKAHDLQGRGYHEEKVRIKDTLLGSKHGCVFDV